MRRFLPFLAGIWIVVALVVGFVPSLRQDDPTPTPTSTMLPEPDGCLRPPDEYTRVQMGSATLNQRTIAMLEHAQTLYGGPLEFTGRGVTQGSYNAGVVALSFGTHDGGGAVDISVRNYPVDWSIRTEDIPIMIDALRTAGFAAWYRTEADGMSPHIHAIAVGDAELSPAAQLQIDGRYGYLRGFNALPQADGVPLPDAHGGPIICNWMRELGYEDLHDDTTVLEPPYEIAIGQSYFTNMTWGQRLNVRSEAGLNFNIVIQLPSESPVTVTDGPRRADGYTWWQIETEDGIVGWAVGFIDGIYSLVPGVDN